MLNEFGKVFRKLRIDKGITMREAASIIEVSPAFLSSIETGRKQIPNKFVELICNTLDLNLTEMSELKQAADLSRRKFEIALKDGSSRRDVELAASFARRFETLSDDEKDKIKKILMERSA